MFFSDSIKGGSHQAVIFSFGGGPPPRGREDPQRGGASDIPPSLGLALLVVLLGAILLGGGGMAKLERFYAEHFEAIYVGAYAAVCVLAAAMWWLIVRGTRALAARWRLLSPVSSPLASVEFGILAGKTKDGLDLYVPRSQRLGHVQIVGATGRGKTESVILPWLVRDLKAGCGAILIDGKGDPELVRRIRDATASWLKPPRLVVFDLGNPKASAVTNPLAHGSVQQITDRLFTALTFEQSFYRAVQLDVCRDVIALIHEVDGAAGKNDGIATFRRIHELLTDDDVLTEAAGSSTNELLRARFATFLSEPPKTRDQQIKGLTSQLGPFAIGEVAALVNGTNGDDSREMLSLSEQILAPAGDVPCVPVVLIPTLKYQDIGHQIGKLLLQELGWAVGERASRSGEGAPFMPVYLDEFSAFVYPGFQNILNKARSSQVALHLSHQSLGDLALVSPEFATVVNTNCNVKCLLGLNDPVTADFFAKHLGTETSEKTTERALKKPLWGKAERTGDLSLREVEAYKIHPNALKNFTRGRGALHMPSPRGNISEEVQFAALGEDDTQPQEVR